MILLVGKIRPVRLQLIHSQYRIASQFRDLIHDPRGGERSDFYRDGMPTKLRHTFGRIRDYQKMLRGSSYNLFAQQRSSGALDQAEIRCDFVGAIDGEIGAESAPRFDD